MKLYTFTLAAGEEINPTLKGSYIACTQAEKTFTLQPEGMDASDFEVMWGLKTPRGFDRVRIYSAYAQTIKLMVGDGQFIDNRTASSASATENNYGASTVGLAASLIVAANVIRQQVLIQNLGGAAIYVGSDNLVTVLNGIKIAPGASYVAKHVQDIYGISGVANQDVRYDEDEI